MGRCWLCRKKIAKGNGPFFRVPKDECRREKWNKLCGMKFSRNALICIDHFSSSDIVMGRRPILLPAAMPIVHHQQSEVMLCAEVPATPNYENKSNVCNDKDPLLLTEASYNSALEEIPMEIGNETFKEQQYPQTESKAAVLTPTDVQRVYESLKVLLGENLFKINKDFQDQENRLKISYVKSESRTISTQTNTRICGTVQVSEFADDYRFSCFFCSETFPLENWIKFIKHLKKKHFPYEEAFKASEYVLDHDYTPINVPQTISDSTTQALHVETVLVDPNLILPRLVEPVELSYNDVFDFFGLEPNYTTKEYMIDTDSPEISNSFGNTERIQIPMPTANEICDLTNNEPFIFSTPHRSKSEKNKTLKKGTHKQTTHNTVGTIGKSKPKQTSNITALSRCLKRSNTIESIKPEEDKQEANSNDSFQHNPTDVPNSNTIETINLEEGDEEDKQEANANESFSQNTTELTFEYTPRDIIDCLLDNMKKYPVLWEFDDHPFNEDYYEAIEELCFTINDKWSLNIDTLKMRRSVNRILSFYCSVYPCGNIENMNPFTHYFDKCAAFLPASVHDIAYARCSHCYRCFKCNSELRFHLLKEQKYLQWPFKCIQCKECFRYMDEYELHKLLPHYLEIFRCKQCNKKFTQRNMYNSHMLEHEIKANNEPGNHVCDVCNKVFKIRRDLIRHKIFHGEKKHKCNLCPKKFSTNAKLKHHIKTHTKQYDLVCEVCGKGFIHQNNLNRHMLRHTGEKITCNICNLRLRKSSLRRHLRLVHVACEGTIESTFKANNYRYKSSLRPKEQRRLRNKYTEIKNYYCKICNIGFDGYKSVAEHNKEHHSDGPKWKCKMCTSEFRRKFNLKYHYRKKHNLHIYQTLKLVEQNEDLDTVLTIKTEELDVFDETQNERNTVEVPLKVDVIKSSDQKFMEEGRMHSDAIQDEIMKASDNIDTLSDGIEIDDKFFENLLQ